MMRLRTILIDIVLLSVSLSVAADELVNRVAAEKRVLTQCQAEPAIAIIGHPDGGAGAAAMVATDLSNSETVVVVERSRFTDVQSELCIPGLDPATMAQGGQLIFAKFYLMIQDHIPNDPPWNLDAVMVRTDTGAMVYSNSITVQDIASLEQGVEQIAQEAASAAAANNYDCQDRFDLVVEHQVQLGCSGMDYIPQTTFTTTANMKVRLVVEDFDPQGVGGTQTGLGTITLTEGGATTVLNMTIQNQLRQCTVQLSTIRTITMGFEEQTTGASFDLAIPSNPAFDWTLSSNMNATPPLIRAPAVMKTLISTTGAEACGSASGDHSTSTPFTHFERNNFSFKPITLNPICTQATLTEPAMGTTPHLGTSQHPAFNPTPMCAINTATTNAWVERKF